MNRVVLREGTVSLAILTSLLLAAGPAAAALGIAPGLPQQPDESEASDHGIDLLALFAAQGDLLGRDTFGPTATAAASGGGGETFRNGFPAGDLDADGRADVLIDEATVDFETGFASHTWKAMSSSGASLWTREYPLADGYLDALPFAIVDLDADGADDILFRAILATVTEGPLVCAGPACTGVLPFVGEWQLQAVDGATGATLWSDTQPILSAFVPTFAFAAGVNEQLFFEGVTNHLYVPALAGDHDGDGNPDVVINQVHALRADNGITGFTPQGFIGSGFGAAAFVTEYHVRSGLDGTTLLSGVLPAGTLPPRALPGPDANADGVPELFAVSPNGAGGAVGFFPFDAPEVHEFLFAGPATLVSLLDGATGDAVWTSAVASVGAWETSAATTGDLDGDGHSDLLVSARTAEADYTYTALSAVDGATLWSFAHDGVPLVSGGAMLADDLDGDGRADPLFVSHIDLFLGGEPTLGAWSGDGSGWLYQATFPVATPESFFWGLHPLGDVDGDGHLDLAYVEQGSDPDTFEPVASVRGVSSADGSVAWSTTRAGFLEVSTPGTLDGAGGDLFAAWQTFDESGATFHAEAFDGTTGTTIWSLAEKDPALVDLRIGSLQGDADGDGRADLIARLSIDEDGVVASLVAMRSGADGSTLWTYP